MIDAVVVALAGMALGAIAFGGLLRPRGGGFDVAVGLVYYGVLNGGVRGQPPTRRWSPSRTNSVAEAINVGDSPIPSVLIASFKLTSSNSFS